MFADTHMSCVATQIHNTYNTWTIRPHSEWFLSTSVLYVAKFNGFKEALTILEAKCECPDALLAQKVWPHCWCPRQALAQGEH